MATDRSDALWSLRSSLSGWLVFSTLLALLAGCARAGDHYLQVEHSLRRGDTERAVHIIESAEPQYGAKSRLLYRMDRGMTLHLAGKYEASNMTLEQADRDVEAIYTRRIRTETKAFLINDTELPYEGDPYEQVMINVIKALNYASGGNWNEALVEARRIDNRLNLLTDRTGAKDGYRDDGFARYLCGVLYEATGDVNNAFIAYRNAYEAYRRAQFWAKTPIPPSLPSDLLRTTEALRFTEEHEEYRRAFPNATWRPLSETQDLAQLVVISYNGRAPYKEDLFIDLPVSMEALNLVLLNRGLNSSRQGRQARVADSALYGLSGSVVRVALPRLVPQKTLIGYSEVSLIGAERTFAARTELVDNLTAVAEKTLADRFTTISVKAVARAAAKYALAEGAGYGTRAAMGNNNNVGPWIGMLVMFLGKAFAIYTEEADKRSWRTLPDEIHMTRLWVPPGTYQMEVRPVSRSGAAGRQEALRTVTLRQGDTSLMTERALP